MLIEINRRVLEQLVKDKDFMYQLITNWSLETKDHWNWWGVSLHSDFKTLMIRTRGASQIAIIYEDSKADYSSDLGHIEKRIVKYRKPR
jgi:hypothetical protein